MARLLDDLLDVSRIRRGRVDIGLPGMDGYSVARSIRETLAGKPCYLIAATGDGQPSDRKKALDAGFDRHLVKPGNETFKLAASEGAGRVKAEPVFIPPLPPPIHVSRIPFADHSGADHSGV
jgi:DNA-binding NarL/FixJ family response regulator